jgi:alpha-L-fucosidase
MHGTKMIAMFWTMYACAHINTIFLQEAGKDAWKKLTAVEAEKRLRRLCGEKKKNGSYKVAEHIVQQWKDITGGGRNALIKQMMIVGGNRAALVRKLTLEKEEEEAAKLDIKGRFCTDKYMYDELKMTKDEVKEVHADCRQNPKQLIRLGPPLYYHVHAS